MARKRLLKKADSRKGHLAAELEDLAGTIDNLSASLGARGRRSQQKVASQGASVLRKASVALRDKSSEELLASAKNEVKARPAVYVAGLFALGFLGGRLLRS
ncbi:MAG: hypothetical protein ACOX6T_01980 [Myxococcales bacterium]